MFKRLSIVGPGSLAKRACGPRNIQSPPGAQEHKRAALTGLILVFLFATPAHGQKQSTLPSVEEQFAAYHQAVSGEADKLSSRPPLRSQLRLRFRLNPSPQFHRTAFTQH